MIDLNEAGRELREHPVAGPTSMGELRRRANGLHRRRVLLTRMVPALVVVALVAGTASALRLGASHGQRVTARPPEGGTPVTLPDVHPAPGSTPLDYGDARVWVPQGWKTIRPTVVHCVVDVEKVILLGNARAGGPPCPTTGSTASPRIGALVAITGIGPHTSYPAATPTTINGLAADVLPAGAGTYPGEVVYDVPALGVTVGVVGTDGRAILDTLGPSARRAVLSPRPITAVPAGWQTVRYEGVQVAVPPAWPAENLSVDRVQPGCGGGSPFPSPIVELGGGFVGASCPPTLDYPLPADGVWLRTQAATVDRLPPYGRLVHDGPIKAYLSLSDDPSTQVAPMPPYATLVLVGTGTPLEMEVGLGADPTIAEHIIDSITAAPPGPKNGPPTSSNVVLANCSGGQITVKGNSEGATGVAVVEVDITNISRSACQVYGGWGITISVGDHVAASGINPTPSTLISGQSLNSRWEWSNYCGAAGPISVTMQLDPKATEPVASSAQGFAAMPRCDNGPGAPSRVSVIAP